MRDRRAVHRVGSGVLLVCLWALAGCEVVATGPTASPATSPTPSVAPRFGWEITSENVGLRTLGLQCGDLPRYTGPSDVPAGTTISGRLIPEPLNLSAGSITIEGSCIRPVSASPGLPIIATTNYNTQKTAHGPVTIRDSDFDGSQLSQEQAGQSTAFIGVGTLSNNYIHGFGSGIALMNTGSRLDALVEHNYVTGLVAWGDASTTGTHSDAFTVRDFDANRHPERRAVVSGNRFDCDSGSDTGAVFIQTYAGRIDNLEITGNLLEGGGYQLGLNQVEYPYGNLLATDNRFSATGYGPAYVQNGPGWTTWDENFIYDPTSDRARGKRVDRP